MEGGKYKKIIDLRVWTKCLITTTPMHMTKKKAVHSGSATNTLH